MMRGNRTKRPYENLLCAYANCRSCACKRAAQVTPTYMAPLIHCASLTFPIGRHIHEWGTGVGYFNICCARYVQ